jgi:hypothetical protein
MLTRTCHWIHAHIPPSLISNVRLACGTIIFLEQISTAVPQTVCANRSELHKHLSEGLNVVKKLKCFTAKSLYIKGVLHEESLTILGRGNKLHELTPATPDTEMLCLCL